jgi:hypothetical protein
MEREKEFLKELILAVKLKLMEMIGEVAIEERKVEVVKVDVKEELLEIAKIIESPFSIHSVGPNGVIEIRVYPFPPHINARNKMGDIDIDEGIEMVIRNFHEGGATKLSVV